MFAIEAVLDIAYHSSADPVRSNDISERHGIPKRYLERVLQGLVHMDVLKGTRGPKGGYTLAKEPHLITLADILTVVNNIEQSTQIRDIETGSKLSIAILLPLWQEMHESNMEFLSSVTLQDLCDRAKVNGVKGTDKNNSDNFIM